MRIELRNVKVSKGDEVEGYVAEVYRAEWNPAAKEFEKVFQGYGAASEDGATSDGAAFVIVDVATRAEAERIIDRLPDGLCDRYYPSVGGDVVTPEATAQA